MWDILNKFAESISSVAQGMTPGQKFLLCLAVIGVSQDIIASQKEPMNAIQQNGDLDNAKYLTNSK